MAYTAADLEMVDDHIAQGEKHITRQLELIARLRSFNLPTSQAEQLLEQFQATLSRHREHRELMIESLNAGP